MPKPKSTVWLSDLADVMRQHGVVQATKRLVTKDGRLEEISVTLGPPNLEPPAFYTPPPALDPDTVTPADAQAIARAHKRRIYADLFPGQALPDDFLDGLPDRPN